MKILVTGGAGFIGSHIVDLYIKEGYEVVVVDDLSTGNAEYINKKAKFYKLDINELNANYYKLEDIFKEERPDIVNHHAAQISVTDSIKDPVFDAKVNILGTLNLLENCIRYGVKKFIFASSGGTVYKETDKLPVDENHPLKPLSPYGVSKMAIENYLYFYKKVHHLDSIIFRYSNVYGPRQDPYGEAGVVAIFTNKMLKGENPIINGDGIQTRDFVYISDAAKVNLLALKEKFESDNKNYEMAIFNIGTGIETSVNELFYKLKKITKANVKEIHGPPKLGELRRSCLSFNKAKKILGWEPEVDIDQGLKLTVNYFKNS
jgi:UDP-glucose 4-epimerase